MKGGNLMHKVKVTWRQLEDILKAKNIIPEDEEVKQITLTKPRTLLIRSEIVRKPKQIQPEEE
jgi:aspartate carbamoyltransferase regulatory subunit